MEPVANTFTASRAWRGQTLSEIAWMSRPVIVPG